MLTYSIKRNKFSLLFLVSLVFIISCHKYKINDLGAAPKASFTVTPVAGQVNKYLLTSTSQNAFMYQWDKANGKGFTSGNATDTVYFSDKGNYTVKLLVYGHAGMDSTSQVINVASDDLTACQGTPMGFISSCTSKKWRLDPAAAAYKVGPGPNDGSWWSSSAGDVTARSCEFNDEYTFSYKDKAFIYDNKGDFFGDGYLGNNTGTCQPSSNYTAAQAPWGSGTFKWSFTPGAGVNKLGQLTVTGLGAHIGLQKVRNGGEVTSGPATSITYDVLSETTSASGDILTLGVDIGGGWWTFRLRSF